MNSILVSFLWITLYVLATVFWISYDYVNYAHKPSWEGFGSANIILFSTGIILVFYTVQTYFLRKEAHKQTELQQKPFLRLKRKEVNEVARLLNIKPEQLIPLEVINIGIGTAKNIHFVVETKHENFNINIKSIDCIGGNGHAVQLQHNLRKGTNNIRIFNSNFHISELVEAITEEDDLIKITINYQDLENNNYNAVMEYNLEYTDAFKIVSQVRVK